MGKKEGYFIKCKFYCARSRSAEWYVVKFFDTYQDAKEYQLNNYTARWRKFTRIVSYCF